VDDAIAGFYTLTVGQVTPEEAPKRLTKGLAKYWMGIMLLARLGMDRHWHGEGVGKALLRDAEQRILQAADLTAVRALNPAAAEWVHVRLIVFHPSRMPLSRAAFADFGYPLASFSATEIRVLLNGNEPCPAEISPPSGLFVRPAESWRGCSGLVEKEETCRAR
jgi:hypothetical protein